MSERTGSRISLRRLPITTAVAAILAIVAAFTLAQRLHAARHRYDDVDFAMFYAWWTDYSAGGDPWLVQGKSIELRPGLTLPRECNNTPFFIEVFSPLARLDQKTAFWIWQALHILCLVAAVLMLARGNDPPLEAAPAIIVLSLALMSRQFTGALVGAAPTPMLLALLSASWFCARRERPVIAGLCLALAALLRLYPVTVGGYFLFGRRWHSLFAAIGCFLVGELLTNPIHWFELATLQMSASYSIVGHAELTMLAFVRKIVAHLAGTTIAGEPFVAVVAITALFDLVLLAIAATATIASRDRTDLDGLLFGLWVALALLMSPLAWIPETLLLLPAYLFGMLAAFSGFQRREALRQIPLIAGAAILTACIATALIKAVPHPGFPMLIAAYLSAALIFWARTKMDSPRDETVLGLARAPRGGEFTGL